MGSAKYHAVRTILRAAQSGACCYCRKRMVSYRMAPPPGGLPHDAETLEHLRRKADGGTNHRSNLALACYECNTGRGNMDWLTYATYKAGEIAA